MSHSPPELRARCPVRSCPVTERKNLGDFGERIAAHRLEADGLTIIARNARLPAGEVDIIAREAADLVFVEVRTRRAGAGLAAESITDTKRERMWRCAMQYCEANALDPETARLDLVTVDVAADGRVAALEHFRGLELPG